MAQQTAVEWLQSLHKKGILIEKSFEMAKAMEKEQIMRANVDGYNEAEKHGETSAEEYYYEKYTK
jgi:hypothetical protein